MNKLIPIIIAVAIVVGGGSFYGGIKYAESKSPRGNFQALQNLSPEERQARLRDMGAGASSALGRRAGAAGANLASGEIIGKDDKSITVKLRDGGSKIIFLSDATEIMKSAKGSLQDLVVGEQVTATGNANSDGSIAAQSVQVRPSLPANQ